jgi:hypothetical protein
MRLFDFGRKTCDGWKEKGMMDSSKKRATEVAESIFKRRIWDEGKKLCPVPTA